MQSYYDLVKGAWELFIKTGDIDTEVIRPELAESWVKVYQRNLLDYTPKLLTEEEIRIKRERNRNLIEKSISVMKDINEVLSGISESYVVALFDDEGDIIELMEKENDKIKMGHRCHEMNGTISALGIAIRTGQIAETIGLENLHSHAQNWHEVGSAIFNYNKSIAGFLAVVNLKGSLPAIKSMVSLGTRLIEAELIKEQISDHNTPILLNIISQIAAAVDEHGRIVNVNRKFLDRTGIKIRKEAIGKLITEYISGNSQIDNLILPAGSINELKNVIIKNSNPAEDGAAGLYTVIRRIVMDDKNRPVSLLIFEDDIKSPAKKSAIRDRQLSFSAITFDQIVGESEEFLKVRDAALRVAKSSFNILIEGESGTGKELIAQAIHMESGATGPFIAINCGSIPKDLLQSELFGYEEGSFTGAQKGGRPGKFELADGGTLFLDEIGEMQKDMQVSLLRFLQDKIIVRIGGSRFKRVDVRIIAATNRNLAEEVALGNFREDLYYRINVIQLTLPPLRERKSDIPLLAEHMLSIIWKQFDTGRKFLADEVIRMLSAYNWPGNVRELKNIIERAFVFSEGDIITPDCLPGYIREITPDSPDKANHFSGTPEYSKPAGNLKNSEMMIISESLKKHNFNISKSAQELGIARNTLYKKIGEFGIRR
ncbi:MAG TPA: sigma 54-interacting transcriptional regulator [Spirochaetota bacterium]|nr:sigma 54-interacting transcriptional regulator [Spirochaetota bacterium]HPS86929.1 sigma 54-interacting transcriptional regulator [Spirochaetota bacterium]